MSFKYVIFISATIHLFSIVHGFSLNTRITGEDCGALPRPPPNAFYVRDKKSNLRVKCNDGYYRDGNSQVKCDRSTSTWRMNVTCYKKACGHPGEPENGDVHGTLYQVGDVVSYTCDECYNLEGNQERQCMNNETWSGDLPTCTVIKCGLLPELENGTIFGANDHCGTAIEFSCNDGFELSGERLISCGTDGKWSGEIPACEKKIVEPDVETTDTDFLPSEEIIATAKTVIVPEQPLKLNKTCNGVDYPKNGFILNGKLGEIYDVGYGLSFACFSKYEIVGPDVIVCQENGLWHSKPPSCQLSHCDRREADPSPGGYGAGGNKIGDTMKYSCNQGYKLIGTKKIHCKEDGNWSGNPPICKSLCDFVTCDEGKHCKFDIAINQAKCVCKEPEDCSAIYKPVCGSDGITYNNECIMKSYACLQDKKIDMIAHGNCIPGGICTIKPVSPCRGYFEVFYFNIESKSCEEIVVGGCHESGWNGFGSLTECQDTCNKPADASMCTGPAKTGPCNEMRTRWYFDTTENICKQFAYGGCFGNQNNFKTKDDCTKICREVNTTVATSTIVDQSITSTTTHGTTQKQCSPCKKETSLCNSLKNNNFSISGKVISKDKHVFTMKVKRIHKDPLQLMNPSGQQIVTIKKYNSDPDCPCLPDILTGSGDIIVVGSYISYDDVLLSISEKSYISKYYGEKQFKC